MEFGEILRELLEERDFSQKQLAQELNLAPSTLGNYIRGIREPDFCTLKAVADYFQVSVDYLIDHHTNNNKNHEEDRLLRLYRNMDDRSKQLYLQIGADILKHTQK